MQYKFGLRSCFHKETEDIILSFGIGIIVQFLCAYVTLPLYALVTQVKSFKKCFLSCTKLSLVLTRGHICFFPLLVTCLIFRLSLHQMGSSMRKTIFTDRVVQGLRNWHKLAKKNLSLKASTSSSSSLQPLRCPRAEILSSDARISGVSRFKYPSGRRELLEIQRVAEEMIECRVNNVPYDGEISFRLWKKQQVISPRGERHRQC